MNIIMPQLGETVTEGTIIIWRKHAGESVQADEILLEIETDKTATEVPSPAAGVLSRIVVPEGETVAVGTTLAVLEVHGTEAAAVAPVAAPPAAVSSASQPAPVAPNARWEREPKVDHLQRPLTPAVRRLISQHDLDPQRIVGTGRNGRISRSDVLAHVQAPAAASVAVTAEATLVPFNRLRKRTAEHMVRSKATSPHVLQAVEVDFGAVVAARQKHRLDWQQRNGVPLTMLPFVAHAICRALVQYPALNATVEGDALRLHADVNLAVAVDLNFDGLVAPVLPRAQTLTLSALARSLHAMAQRVRSGKFSPDELKGGTYTLSNSGSFGTLITAPIINQPQVAILSMDGVHKRATVIETEAGDSIAIRPVGVLAQSFDHRAVDGAYSAAYLRTLKGVMETSDWMQLLEG